MSRSTHAMVCALAALAGCARSAPPAPAPTAGPVPVATPGAPARTAMDERLDKYTTVRLTADLAQLTERERQMIPLLIDAAREMDAIFWLQAYGDREELMASIRDPQMRRFAEINYGPWDRLEGNEAFVPGAAPKTPGSNFYPKDMTRQEFEAAVAGGGARADSLRSLYTLVRRDAAGRLHSIPYHIAFRPYVERASERLRAAAALADDAGLRRYLELRARALLDDRYQPSDLAWMDMKDNTLEVIIGPIETYEDQLFGYKAANEAFILLKDRDWSRRLERYAQLLPGLQRALPVPEQFKRESPGSDAQLNAYDALYYAGDANAGSKTIAINLPNDEEVQLRKGTRRLQLKNAMQAKFDRILVPIAGELIAPDQRQHVEFDAFFENTMFHEVAHGLGIKNTLAGGTVREALRERAGALEEGKADVLGLWMITHLAQQGEIAETELRDNYVTFLAGIFRSVRFGASSAHGQANVARFHFFRERGAFQRDPATGTYRVDFDRMREAVNALSEQILRFQGEGDYAGVGQFMERYGAVGAELEGDLARLSRSGIPVDIVFEQGMEVLQ